MWKEFYSAMESPALPILAMACFLGSFLIILIRNYGHAKARDFDSVASLPLVSDEQSVPEARHE